MEITQEKFNNLATKNDLKAIRNEMATKDDLKNFATKDELNKLSNKVDKVVVGLVNTQEELKEVKERMVTKDDFQKKTSEILNAIDSFAKKVDNVEIEQTANLAAHDRFETRITRVEKHLDLKPAS